MIKDNHKYCHTCGVHHRGCPCGVGGARCFDDAHPYFTNADTALFLLREGRVTPRKDRKIGMAVDYTWRKAHG